MRPAPNTNGGSGKGHQAPIQLEQISQDSLREKNIKHTYQKAGKLWMLSNAVWEKEPRRRVAGLRSLAFVLVGDGTDSASRLN